MSQYVFLLGREPDLSLAELQSIFPSLVRKGMWAFFDGELSMDQIAALGGTIKIGQLLESHVSKNTLVEILSRHIAPKCISGKKLRVGVDMFVPSLAHLVFRVKDRLKKDGHSIRIVQHEGGRLKTATTLHEKLLSQGMELMVFPEGSSFFVAQTLWIQDIDAYSRRDIGRHRSMTVGMMPPKIAQIMLNLGTKSDKNYAIWDPFCGLGTTLIEAGTAGYKHLYGSDISSEMVGITQKNTNGLDAVIEVFPGDAKSIHSVILRDKTVIVTEGMLGKNFAQATIAHESVVQERKSLTQLYTSFLSSAWKNPLVESIVFCLPFWNIGRESIFMPEMALLSDRWVIDPICLYGKRYLQHSRPGQLVGREIVVVRRK